MVFMAGLILLPWLLILPSFFHFVSHIRILFLPIGGGELLFFYYTKLSHFNIIESNFE